MLGPSKYVHGSVGFAKLGNLTLENVLEEEEVITMWREETQERITKKRTKNKAKTTKPDSEWKSCEGQS
ncbi:hypothetical protein Tco_1192512 [Tanacetum coccineum]